MTLNQPKENVFAKKKFQAHNSKVKVTEKLYKLLLDNFSENKEAQEALINLYQSTTSNINQRILDEIIIQLIKLYKQGQFSDVVKKGKVITKQIPNNFSIWNIVGASYAELGKFNKAINAYNKSISLMPHFSEGYNNIGVVLQNQNKFTDAVDMFKKSISLKPNYAEAYNNLGIALHHLGDLNKAIEAYKKSISLKPNQAQVLNNMGLTLHDQGKMKEGLTYFIKAISLKPSYAEAYCNMGLTLQCLGKLDDSINAFHKSILINPNNAEGYNNMGVILKNQGELCKAIKAFEKAILLKPRYAEAYRNLGVALNDIGMLEKAIKIFNKAILLKPDNAETHMNLSFTLLCNGRLKEGLDEYEWRWKTKKFKPEERKFNQSLWDGKTIIKNKRLLIWSEQGIGDSINWSYFLSFISSKTNYCILECKEKLVPLLQRSFPNIEVRVENRNFDKSRTDFDFHLPMGSLNKYYFRENLKNVKVNSFLSPDPKRVRFWRKRLKSIGEKPYVGISWKSSNITSERQPNYAPIMDWTPLLKLPNVTFVNLQYTDFENDLNKIQNEIGVNVHNFNDLDHFNDLLEVASLCAALDFVVSIQSSVPLISAGVGTSTKLASWKHSSWNNILHNPIGPKIKKFEKNIMEPWSKIFHLIAEDILKNKQIGSLYEQN